MAYVSLLLRRWFTGGALVLVHLWFTFCAPVVHGVRPWLAASGSPLVHRWRTSGSPPLVRLRFASDHILPTSCSSVSRLVHIWFASVAPLVRLCFASGSPLVRLCCASGTPLVHLWGGSGCRLPAKVYGNVASFCPRHIESAQAQTLHGQTAAPSCRLHTGVQ